MPTEYRRLVFPNRELRQALAAHGGDQVELPAGDIIAIAIVEDGQQIVRATFLDAANNSTFTADFIAEYIAAALIRHCIEHRVPMPKKSRKSLRLMGDNLSLDIVIRETKLVDITAD
ncbi:MAG: hypothetical protein WEC41_06540 [Dongiaceae bacterium]